MLFEIYLAVLGAKNQTISDQTPVDNTSVCHTTNGAFFVIGWKTS